MPASYNDLFADAAIRDHVGWVWYQRTVRVPRGWAGERVFVRLDAATHEGVVYVDDTEVADHVGGYTPFEADITELVTAGREFRLTVGVSNELTNITIPPGSIIVTDDGGRKQEYLHDFYNYAGLARSVWLYSAPAVRVTDLTVTTDVDGSTGVIGFDVETTGADPVRVTVRDAEGTEVGSGEGVAGVVRVDDVKLWQPGAAYLYTLTAQALVGGEVVDEYSLPVGVRTIEVRGMQFLINGEPFYFTGFGKHEDSAVRGKGHDNAYLVHDFQLMDWIGANSFRTSHYPYAEEVMEFADRHGIVVIDEVGAVGLNLAMGGGIFGGQTKLDLRPREHQRRHAGHARPGHPRAHRPRQEPRERGHVVDHQRTGLERARCARVLRASGGPHPRARPDPPGDLRECHVLEPRGRPHRRPVRRHLPEPLLRLVRRLGRPCRRRAEARGRAPRLAAEVRPPAHHDRVRRRHRRRLPLDLRHAVHRGVPDELLDMYHRVHDRVEAMVGEQVWNFADFQTKNGFARVDGNKKGVFTRDRKPKAAAHALRARWTGLKK